MPTPRGLVTWKPIGFLSILSFLNSCSYLTLQSPCQIFTDRALLTADYMTLAKDFEKGCCCDCCWCSSKVTREWRVLWHLRQYSTVVVWGLFAWRLIMAKMTPACMLHPPFLVPVSLCPGTWTGAKIPGQTPLSPDVTGENH